MLSLDKIASGGTVMIIQALSPCTDEQNTCDDDKCGAFYYGVLGTIKRVKKVKQR